MLLVGNVIPNIMDDGKDIELVMINTRLPNVLWIYLDPLHTEYWNMPVINYFDNEDHIRIVTHDDYLNIDRNEPGELQPGNIDNGTDNEPDNV